MKVPKNVHAWEIKGYALITKKLRNQIREGLKEKFGSLHKAEIALKLSDYYHGKLHETFTRKDILFKLIKESKINYWEAEKHILKWKDTAPQKSYRIKFPIKPNLIHIRIVSHLIGDGTISRTSTWCQKDVRPLATLQKKIFNRNLKIRKNVITIPKVLIKVISKSLDLGPKILNKRQLMKRLICLQKKYKVQVLTAIIEDEGTCDKNRLTIRMNNKELMLLLSKLIDSLNYPRSNLTKQSYKRYGIKKYIWKIDLNTAGIRKYWKDITKMEGDYGRIIGLWKKRKLTEKLSKQKANVYGWNRNKRLEKEILSLGRFKNISFDDIKKTLNLTDNQTSSVLRKMLNKNLIKRINRGKYKIK